MYFKYNFLVTPDELTSHSNLVVFLESSPPNRSLISEVCSKSYNIEGKYLTTVQICASLGKLEHLMSLPYKNLRQEIQKDDYAALYLAIFAKQSKILNYLILPLTTEDLHEAVIAKYKYYGILRFAATYGSIDTVKFMESLLTTAEISRALKDTQYDIFRRAVCCNHQDIVTLLETYLTSEEIKTMFISDNYDFLKFGASAGDSHGIPIFNYAQNYMTSAEIKEAIKAEDYYILREAAKAGCHDTVNYFLSVDVVLAYAEAHGKEYGRKYVYPYIQQKLVTLKQTKNDFEKQNPLDVYNLNDEEAHHAFYMARSLIRRNNPALNDDLIFLLSIPLVRALVAMSVNDGPINELLRLAQAQGNQAAINTLFTIPAVLEQAERDDYYRWESRGGIDLSQLAPDKKSSMIALANEPTLSPLSEFSVFQPAETKEQQGQHGFTLTQ